MLEFGPDICLAERCLNDRQKRQNSSRQKILELP